MRMAIMPMLVSVTKEKRRIWLKGCMSRASSGDSRTTSRVSCISPSPNDSKCSSLREERAVEKARMMKIMMMRMRFRSSNITPRFHVSAAIRVLKARICMAWDQRRRETSAEIARPKKLSDDVSPSSWSISSAPRQGSTRTAGGISMTATIRCMLKEVVSQRGTGRLKPRMYIRFVWLRRTCNQQKRRRTTAVQTAAPAAMRRGTK
mmetsp:Transcript_52382/g.122909  ORF Transcript_52382/g.122909 Transcript_52382/m.122909 type:complete len:206 (+) Transcript_52382:429-1046(+)